MREVQLAKSAIVSGIKILMKKLAVRPEDIASVYAKPNISPRRSAMSKFPAAAIFTGCLWNPCTFFSATFSGLSLSYSKI